MNRPFIVGILLIAGLAYVGGLGGQYIPTNGDELVYIHIARLTAEAGQWLPLVSDLPNMRNTKPPLLFWQAIAAGGGPGTGVDAMQGWTLWRLRLPSLLYTGATAALVGWAVWRLRQDCWRALLAAGLFLAFYSSFRYGRPYLTSAPETFWLCLPFFGLWAWVTRAAATGPDLPKPGISAGTWLALSLLAGGAWGLGLLYKSFALIAPAAAGLGLGLAGLVLQPGTSAVGSFRPWPWKPLVTATAWVALAALVALAVFALWFVFDPDPKAVWQEFVVGENVGKMGDKLGWWHEALRGGGSSLWAQALSYLENIGLFWPVGLGLLVWSWGWVRAQGSLGAAWRQLPPWAWVLLAWLAVWWCVFMVPSQRSARYVIPAMPALAIALALAWERLGRAWFAASLWFLLPLYGVMARIGWVMAEEGMASPGQTLAWALAVALGVAPMLRAAWGAVRPVAAWSHLREGTVVSALAFWLSLGLLTAPLDGPTGRYDGLAKGPFQARSVAVPNNFNAQWERFEFLLPRPTGAPGSGPRTLKPFDMALVLQPDANERLHALLQTHDAVVWMGRDATEARAPCLPNCQVLATRWVVRERHRPGEITLSNLWQPQAWLFTREWVLAPGRLP